MTNQENPMQSLTLDDFQPYLNQIFITRLDHGELYLLELVELCELGSSPGPEFREPFSLAFRNPNKSAYLPQGTYRLENEGLGSLDLFIVPLGPDASGMRYQVIFS